MLFCSENSDFISMDVIDADWIKARLTGKRGEQARLADVLGINADKMSRIMRGKRRVQPEEIPRVLDFFGETLSGEQNKTRQKAQEKLSGVPDDKLAEVIRFIDYVRDNPALEEDPDTQE